MRILHADDHPVFRNGLRSVLEDLSTHVEVLEARNIAEALDILHTQAAIDLIVLDLNMPGMERFQGCAQLAEVASNCPQVIVSASESYQDVRLAQAAGVQAYFPKTSTRDLLLQGLQAVLRGEQYFPKHLLLPQPTLSRRQLEVLALLSQGLPNKTIATQLGVSETTVKSHVRGILQALDVRTRTQAVMKGQALKLL